MSAQFHFQLPDWPPQRLVREAVMAWGLRHLDEKELNPDDSPWPLIRGAVLAFLRHQQSDYHERLRARCEYDKEFRDTLASQIAAAAFRKYPWLGVDDPRPFQESGDKPGLPFNEVSKSLANLHEIRDQLISAICDLQREGNHRVAIAALQIELEETRKKIDRFYRFLTAPKIRKSETGGDLTRAFLRVHAPDELGKYVFCTSKSPSPNHLKYLGFRCPRCNASVVRLKQAIAFGQGYGRMVVQSCHCLTFAIHCPEGPGHLSPVTLEKWREYCAKIDTEEKS
jgi:hypothetical protein